MDVGHRAPRNLPVPEELRTLRCLRAAVPALASEASFGIEQRLAQRIITGQRAENQGP